MSSCLACKEEFAEADLTHPDSLSVGRDRPPSTCRPCATAFDAEFVAGGGVIADLPWKKATHDVGGSDIITLVQKLQPGEYEIIRRDAEMRAMRAWADARVAEQAPKGPSLRERLLDSKTLKKQPLPKPLIRDVLEMESEAWLIGPPKEFKSFVALDWALHVATGRAWRDRPVHKGPVLYVAAEGSKGIRKRVAAWEIRHGIEDPEDFYVLPAPVQAKGQADRWADPMLSAEWHELVALAVELKAVMVVLDTQARMTVGLEENSNSSMGLWIEAVRVLKEATKAAVLVVHHTGKVGTSARGAGALNGAQDHEWRVQRVGGDKALSVDIIQTENKDGADDARISVDLQVVDLGVLDDMGRSVTSLVLAGDAERSGGVRGAVAAGERLDILSTSLSTRQWITQVLLRLDVEGEGAPRGRLYTAIVEQQAADGLAVKDRLKRGTFDSTLKRMLDEPPGTRTLHPLGVSRVTLKSPLGGLL